MSTMSVDHIVLSSEEKDVTVDSWTIVGNCSIKPVDYPRACCYGVVIVAKKIGGGTLSFRLWDYVDGSAIGQEDNIAPADWDDAFEMDVSTPPTINSNGLIVIQLQMKCDGAVGTAKHAFSALRVC